MGLNETPVLFWSIIHETTVVEHNTQQCCRSASEVLVHRLASCHPPVTSDLMKHAELLPSHSGLMKHAELPPSPNGLMKHAELHPSPSGLMRHAELPPSPSGLMKHA